MKTNPADLLPLAYRTANRIIRNSVLAEEAAERAIHRLTLEILAGKEPRLPAAWIRTATKRSACEVLRNEWSRHRMLDESENLASEVRDSNRESLREELRRAMASRLTRRQLQVLEAALAFRNTRDAAEACCMAPRDFRRYLDTISRHARNQLELPSAAPPLRRWPRPPRA
ncbi:MAG: hypothetical protein WCR59_06060 [Planctomycetota bacterium]|jgi:DNA-directed RNA polymerase specialized sigma24 family protein